MAQPLVPNRKNLDLSRKLMAVCDEKDRSHEEVAEAVKLLIEKGVDIAAAHPKGKDGAIHLAAQRGHEEAVKLLLAKKKSLVNARGTNGWTPLMCAVKWSYSVSLCKTLIDAGADIHLKDACGDTILASCVSDKKTPPEIVRELIDRGAEFKFYQRPYPPIIFAARHGAKEVVELMLEKGCRSDVKDREGRTLMNAAIEGKNHETVKFLMARGADPHSRDVSGFGKTLLEYAADSGDVDLIKAVTTALAAKDGKQAQHETFGTLALAAKKGDTATVKTLVEAGIPVDSANWEGETGLMMSAAYGRLTVLQYLLSKGADINARDKNGSTALHYAAAESQVEAIGILIQAGADVADTNSFNWTPLMQSAHKGFFAGVEALIAAKSPLDIIDHEWGLTALSLAKLAKGEKAIQLLEQAGAKERQIRMRKPNEAIFSPLDCDICAYLPHAKELESAYEPREFPGLEIAHEKREGNQHMVDSDMVKRCVNCGTHYYHHYYFDDEDSLGGAGPSCNQFFARYNPLMLRDYFTVNSLRADLVEFSKRYPAILGEFETAWREGREMKPYIRLSVLETLLDEYIMVKKWEALRAFFFEHARPDFRLYTIHNLLCIYSLEGKQVDYPSPYRERCCPETVRTKVRTLLQRHQKEFSAALETTLTAGETNHAKMVAVTRDKAERLKFF